MNAKLEAILKSNATKFAVETAKNVAINVAVGFVVSAAVHGAIKLVEYAADSLTKESAEVVE